MLEKNKYCISISNKISIETIIKKINRTNFIEYRLDTGYILKELERIIKNYKCIITPKILRKKDIQKFKDIIDLLPEYIDIDFQIFEDLSINLVNYSRSKNVKIILSIHSCNVNENIIELLNKIYKMKSLDPDIIKYVFANEEARFIEQAFKIYEEIGTNKLLLFGIGKNLKHTRFEALRKGAPFMYVFDEEFGATAEGQFSINEINNLRI